MQVVVVVSIVLAAVALSLIAPDLMAGLLTEVIAAVVADLLLQLVRRDRTPRE